MSIEGKALGGRYQIQDKIGSGGMASVYRGVDKVLGRTVAVKVMLPQYASDPMFAARFRQEAQAAAGLSSPYIVAVYDWGQDGDTYYIVMEFIRGTDLKKGIRSHGALAPRKAAQIGAQVCAALGAAHRHEIIHRDVKPQNIMIQPDGTAIMTDFGIARAKNSHLTQTNSVLGTAHYVSPEQTQGKELGPESDLYSLGIVMYEAVTGQVPFDGDEAITVALKQVNDDPVPPSQINPKVDPEFEAIFLKCMEKNPKNRFHSADELRRVLNNYIAGRPTGLISADANMKAVPASKDQTKVMVRPGDPTRKLNRPNGGRHSNIGMGGAAFSTSFEPAPVKKKPIWPIIAGALAAIAIVIIALVILLTGGNSKQADVPNLINLTQEEAVSSITNSGFKLGQVSQEYSDTVETGRVLDQDPDANLKKAEGSQINIVLSRGPEPAKALQMPDLTNKTASEAEKIIKDLGLVPAAGDAVYDPRIEPGKVASQKPVAGTKVVEGDTVTYSLSLGEESIEVPKVVGLEKEAAEKALKDAGFAVEVSTTNSNDVAQNKVISQNPSDGNKLVKGKTVSIVVSSGPNNVRVPNVVGMIQSNAEATLSAAGFKVSVEQLKSEGSKKVLRQSVEAGSEAPSGTTVTISVDVEPIRPESRPTSQTSPGTRPNNNNSEPIGDLGEHLSPGVSPGE